MELWDILDENGQKTGRTVERGRPMAADEYHQVVCVWVVDSQNRFFITRRSAYIPYPLLWAATGGSAIAGEDSLQAALRETAEETGITLKPENGVLFKRYKQQHPYPNFCDVWIFRQDIDLKKVILQPGETCGAQLAYKDDIKALLKSGRFFDGYPYLDEMFDYLNV